ncbi:MAG: amidohydrolase family protein [Flavobacteriales bacterium]|nr:amidohydrolase family protein [Flavobacteriales bacterium]
MNRQYILLATAALIGMNVPVEAQTPASPQTTSILIMDATVHVGNGQFIREGAVGFDKGKITFVGRASEADTTAFGEVIHAKDKHLYPGLILPDNTLGLTEIDAIRPTLDFNETGSMNPNVRALVAFNTDSKIIPTLRANGVLLSQATPQGGLISGTSAIMQLDGWNWEDAVLEPEDGIHMHWPVTRYRGNPWRGEEGIQENKNKPDVLEELGLFFDRANAYAKDKQPESTNMKLHAMQGLFDGSRNLYIHVNDAREIMESVKFAQSKNVKKIVVVGAADAWMVTDFLKENHIPVILRRAHELPYRADEAVDQPYKTAAALFRAQIPYCLDYAGDMEAMGARNLPFVAGTTVAYGVPKEEALASITLHAAEILGISDRVGSLEVGKDATLFLSTGDVMEMMKNHLEVAYIAGKKLDLDTHQKQLYREYAKKYGQEIKE